jgi:hypothetical protein
LIVLGTFLRRAYLGGGILGWLRLIVLGAARWISEFGRWRRRLLTSGCGDPRVADEGERWKGEVAEGL